MGTDEVFESKIDHKGFKITVEVLNPEYMAGKIDKTTKTNTFYGSGYYVYVTVEDGVSMDGHGYTKPLALVSSMVDTVSEINMLPALLTCVIARIVNDGRTDEAKLYLELADALREWPILKQG